MRSGYVLSKRLVAFLILLVAACSACSAAQHPKNVIVIIGDGMGIGAITGARCTGPGEDGKLVMDSMPVTGLAKTHSQANLVTDSAASGTALATGHKTLNGRISVTAADKTLPTILELANSMGKSTGVVTTDGVTSATPAVFYAHIDSRNKHEDIALQLVRSNITVAMGSGKAFFVPKSSGSRTGREDGQDLTVVARQKGFDVVLDTRTMAASKSNRILGLFDFGAGGPTLRSMLNKALSVLSRDPDGFFIMAESCLPDKGGHANDSAISFQGVMALENALRSALEFAKKDGNTLVVVTADHDTGGLAVLDKDDKNPKYKPGWVSKGHTGNMVTIYAYGPGAEKFAGTHDNTYIPYVLAGLWGRTLGK